MPPTGNEPVFSSDAKRSLSPESERDLWRNGYFFALLLLFTFGIFLIIFGASVFPDGSVGNVVLIGIGISMAPSAIVAALFRFFLFREAQHQLTAPVLDEFKERLGPAIKNEVVGIIGEYRSEITTLRDVRDAGIVRPVRRREIGLKAFASAIDTEEHEIMLIGMRTQRAQARMSLRKSMREKGLHLRVNDF